MALASALLPQLVYLHNSIKMAFNLSHINTKTNFPLKARSNLNRSSSSARYVPTVALAQNQSYWAAIEAEIDTYLKKSIPIRPPETVFEPMHHLTFAAPRTAASALCVAACELVGGDRSQALVAASAIHLVHAAAYAHEHLPLTDRPRPESKPEIQHKYSPNIELLTPDGMVPFGFELLARSMDPAQNDDPDRILRAIIEISRAGGSEGMIYGLYKEREIVDLNHSRPDFIEYVCKKKYGELHACGAACGAILAGAAEDEIEKLRNFGRYAGTLRGIMENKNYIPEIGNIISKLRESAMEELEGFNGKNTELISSLVAESSQVAESLCEAA